MDINHLLLNHDYYTEILNELDNKPDLVFASSFNVYAAINEVGVNYAEFGDKYINGIYRIFNKLTELKIKTKLLIGLPGYRPCNINCQDCKEKFVGLCDRVLRTVEHWPDFEWKVTANSHFKTFGFVYGKKIISIIGSSNLTGSNADEANLVVDGKAATDIFRLFVGRYNKAFTLDQDFIDDHIRESLSNTKY